MPAEMMTRVGAVMRDHRDTHRLNRGASRFGSARIAPAYSECGREARETDVNEAALAS